MSSSRPGLRLLCPHLLLLLSLPLLAGLAGCGPASSDNAPGIESRARVSKLPLSEQGLAPGSNPLTSATPVADPGSLASKNETGATDGQVVPAWMANELASPNVALETEAESTPPGGVDPFIQALNDKEVGAEELYEGQENQDLNEGQENQDHEEDGEK